MIFETLKNHKKCLQTRFPTQNRISYTSQLPSAPVGPQLLPYNPPQNSTPRPNNVNLITLLDQLLTISFQPAPGNPIDTSHLLDLFIQKHVP